MFKAGYQRVQIGNESNLFQEDGSKCKKKLLIIIIIILIIGASLLFYFFYYKKINKNKTNIENFSNQNLKEKYKLLTEEIIKYEKSLPKITNEEIEEFQRINSQDIPKDPIKYKKSDFPDISIVIIMHNHAHCIKKAIRSVQNQSLKNIEIIIVDDCSLDNSTETVEELMKDDDRIKLLKHEYNEGIMITRRDAIRMAKGKYVSVLEPDNTFLHKNILNNSLYVANMANLDIVEFYSSYYTLGTFKGFYHYHGDFPILYQPELRFKFIQFNDDPASRPIKCRNLWGKIIKNEIFQKSIDNIPPKYLNDYINSFESIIITFSLYQSAQNYYCLRQPGYYYSSDEDSKTYPLIKDKKCQTREGIIKEMDHVKFLNYLMEKLEDNEFEKQILYHELKSINNWTYTNFKKTIKQHFNLIYNVLDDLLKSKYITDNQKKHLSQIKDEIKENEKNS